MNKLADELARIAEESFSMSDSKLDTLTDKLKKL